MNTPRFETLLLLALTAACARGPAVLTDQERAVIAASVDSATRVFEAAQRELNPEHAIAHLAPDFLMRVDGIRMDYDSVAAGIRRTITGFTHLEPGFSDLVVRVLGPDIALATFLFRDSAVTKSGQVRTSAGPTTFIWERRRGQWLIIYADADHQQRPPQP